MPPAPESILVDKLRALDAAIAAGRASPDIARREVARDGGIVHSEISFDTRDSALRELLGRLLVRHRIPIVRRKRQRPTVLVFMAPSVFVDECLGPELGKLPVILDHLPEAEASSAGKVMRQAYRCRDAKQAKKLLEGLARQLQSRHPSAATSLREGLDETLTVKAMGLPEALERTLSTTNPIENLMGSIRALTRRVRRWRGGEMIERWVAVALQEASKRFHRVRGSAGMKKLAEVLDRGAVTLVNEREAA